MSLSTKAWTYGYKIMGAAIVLLVLGAVVLVSLNNAQLRAENQAMYSDLQASQSNAQRLYEQLLALGEDPEGEEPDEVVSGPAGAEGPTGPRGATGPVGEQGEPGPPGPAGADGADGAGGASGETGATGPQGPVGPQGPQGPAGTEGPAGSAGPAGPTCPDSYSLRLVWLQVADDESGDFTRQLAAICQPTT
ncbi:hypothetical protein ACWKWN_18355 [Microbacterium trichothecenolyticum]